jgi:hypothetical protein
VEKKERPGVNTLSKSLIEVNEGVGQGIKPYRDKKKYKNKGWR